MQFSEMAQLNNHLAPNNWQKFFMEVVSLELYQLISPKASIFFLMDC